MTEQEKRFAAELRKWWSFDDGQMHTHSWHSREDFIERKLPELLSSVAQAARVTCDCGVMCQDHGKEGNCRYLRPERNTLRKLVDIVYQHATESTAVPATLTADLLIDRAYAVTSTDGSGK